MALVTNDFVSFHVFNTVFTPTFKGGMPLTSKIVLYFPTMSWDMTGLRKSGCEDEMGEKKWQVIHIHLLWWFTPWNMYFNLAWFNVGVHKHCIAHCPMFCTFLYGVGHTLFCSSVEPILPYPSQSLTHSQLRWRQRMTLPGHDGVATSYTLIHLVFNIHLGYSE